MTEVLSELWKLIEADLRRARETLPPSVATDPAVKEYHALAGHNEWELASDMLEEYVVNHPVRAEFWLALRDAAAKMQLSGPAERFEAKFRGLK